MVDLFIDKNNITLSEDQFIAKVVEVHKGGAFVVVCDDAYKPNRQDIWYVTIRGKFMKIKRSFQNYLAVGDLVVCRKSSAENSGSIDLPTASVDKVLSRDNAFCRSGSSKKDPKQIIATNYDQLLILTSISSPEIKWQMLDAYLSSLEGGCDQVIMVFTKYDLFHLLSDKNKQEFEERHMYYKSLGVDVYKTSLIDGVLDSEGIKVVNRLNGRISVFVGLSGVGKSSFINCCEPEMDQEIGKVSEAYSGGKHTTTGVRLLFTQDSGILIDTPGVRSWRLTYMDKLELAQSYSDILELSSECKFRDCLHIKESGCAVKPNVGSPKLPEWRYRSYLKHAQMID